ncbi:hypothetical protein [Roseicella aquatilis]|uniref:Uncharacterized protein n=1 Tax=Roseicella aquatilis TaxID=2527868 RepID=A0A4V2WLV8_9PROT|nr:hypothetical protein [Roseicella aquatilis]TCZ64925.1 hypothetical protein EXY23_06025 [Roseicella aquatilis]
MHKAILTIGLSGTAMLAIGLSGLPARAGPCSAEIAELARALSASPALAGSPTSGALTGAGPGSSPAPASGSGAGGSPATAAGSPDRLAGTSAGGRQGGTAGTREMNAVVGNQIATSSDDVRRQQEGRPTAAAAAEMGQRAQSDRARVEVVPGQPGAAPGPDDRTARAKSELETARALDQRDDPGCRDAVGRVRGLMQGG